MRLQVINMHRRHMLVIMRIKNVSPLNILGATRVRNTWDFDGHLAWRGGVARGRKEAGAGQTSKKTERGLFKFKWRWGDNRWGFFFLCLFHRTVWEGCHYSSSTDVCLVAKSRCCTVLYLQQRKMKKLQMTAWERDRKKILSISFSFLLLALLLFLP